ncbi:hypothetical protein HK097_009777 [Rhizophlyctis rosea]|uniref:Uncharacterized protein n=1 Tax=Rhizophlyctis rosea TaxID=64517 RepID=A0AAD5SID3_9FUNG|nr:hypothetical protein HK097_009777 [Rhizophlyctis rosea]
MTIAKPTAIALYYVFTSIGFILMIGNLCYAIHHAYVKRTKFNFALVLCATLWSASFIPLFITAKLTVDLTNVRITLAMLKDIDRLKTCLRAYNMVYGLATLVYLLIEQTRFKVIKGVMPYSKIYDYVFAALTFAIWIATFFYYGVINTTNSTNTGTAIAAYAVYGLTVDNILSFTFIYQLYKNRQKLHKGTSNPQFVLVVRALIVLCIVSWSGLIVFLVGLYVYANDNLMRTLLFRIGYSFTPIQFSAMLVFMYSIKTLLAQPAPRPSSVISSGNASTLGKAKDATHTASVVSKTEKTRVMADGEEATLGRPPTSIV